MRRVSSITILIAAVALGLAIGLGLQKASSSAAKSGATTRVELGEHRPKGFSAQRQTSSSALKMERGSKVARILEQSIATSTNVMRWLHWFEAMERATLADFPPLARLAQSDPAALRLLALRWTELDANNLLRNLAPPKGGKVDELASVLFQEWPKREPEAVVAALSKPENALHRHYWGAHVMEAVLEVDVERGLRLYREWDMDGFSPRMNAVAKWAAKDPQHAAEFVVNNPAGHASELAMETIGKEWARTDPKGAVEFGISTRSEFASKLATTALKVWSETQLGEAANWLAEADARTRSRLSPAFVEGWARKSPVEAIDWSEANLSGSALSQAVGAVVKGAAETDVAHAAKLVSGMEASAGRAEGAAVIAEKWLPSWSTEDKKAPPEAVAWLGKLDRESLARALDRVQWWWATSDPSSLAAFLTACDEPLPVHAYGAIIRTMVGRNPIDAIEWTQTLPEHSRLAVGARAFSEWRFAQFDQAMRWLSDLPPNDPRRQPFFKTAIEDLAYDPRALDHFAALAPAERAAAHEILSAAPIPAEKRKRLLQALRN